VNGEDRDHRAVSQHRLLTAPIGDVRDHRAVLQHRLLTAPIGNQSTAE
jgi:hypothetical protein